MASTSGVTHGRGCIPRHMPPGISHLSTLSDAQFLQKFRLSKGAVIILQASLRNTTLANGDVPLHLQLLTTLRYYATGRLVRAAAVAKLRKERTRTLVSHVSTTIVNELKERHLDFPDTQQREIYKAEFVEIGQLINVIGCVNSVPIPLGGFMGIEVGIGNRQYGHKYLKLVVVCGPQSQITSLMVQPYTEDDWQVFRDSCLDNALLNGEFEGYLLANHNFPPRRYFIIPIASPRNWIDELFNFAHYTTMQVGRHAVELMSVRFPCLVTAMDLLHPSNLNVVVACGILHNFCLNHSVPLPRSNLNSTLGTRSNLFFQNRAPPAQNREE